MASPFKTALYSTSGNQHILDGSTLTPDILDRKNGVIRYNDYEKLAESISNLTSGRSANMFAETFTGSLEAALRQSEDLGANLEDVTLDTAFNTSSTLSQQLEQVARLVKLRSLLGAERDVFMTEVGGFDSHNTFDLAKLVDVNTGLLNFREEMKAQGTWDNVVILTVSDFGTAPQYFTKHNILMSRAILFAVP
jgi:uncharacterized protein (DUF1501 family)